MSKHNFIESSAHGSNYDVVIFCTWCGKVVWHFNRVESNVEKLQKDIKEPCIHDPMTNTTHNADKGEQT